MTVACFDIGGTSVKFGLIGTNKQVETREDIATPKSRKDLLEWMNNKITSYHIRAISISVPGAVDRVSGEIQGLSAIPYIHGVSWYALLEHHNVPVYLENDANCVGLSELAVDEVTENCACVVCGTGIGGALIINRQLVRGKKSYGGEFGYMMINGVSTPIKNWSQLASTGSLVRAVKAQAKDTNEEWNGKKIFECAQNGDKLCQDAICTMVHHFAVGLLNIYYCFDPEIIYIGGSISQNPDFISRVKQELQRLSTLYHDDFPEIPLIKACTHTKDANLVGAYMNTLQH
ncbi:MULTISPECIES: ROK family protein [unclassified Granulicatella]|uniref:ROK family protein n=1 Tax=unclassified Granulicatella TaxID=2630493 RepID=UPI001074815C|nr:MULTISPECIES: ROK family protein [unclassified Granulicatella]MBF0780691.1 ROK family protein [Granulicatella sp. 19428wC4_WM01]TFU94233.1 ROK family protein [Granulicatella sp. WM01]